MSVLFFVTVFSGCGDDGKTLVWGIEGSVFLENLRSGDTDFLKELDFTRHKPEEIFRLGDGAALCTASAAAPLGLKAVVRRFLELEYGKGREPYKQEAGNRLAALLVGESSYEEAEKVLSSMVKTYPLNGNYFYRLIETRYRQQEYSSVLKMFEEIRSSKMPPVTTLYPAEELLLWEAVASARENRTGWENLFRTLFYDYPASKVHVRAFEFIGIAQPRIARFPAEEIAAFTGKAKMAVQEYGNAAANFDRAMRAGSTVLGSSWMIREAGRSWQGAGRSVEGAEKLIALIPSLRTGELFAARETTGRLYRVANRYESAIEQFDLAYPLAPDDAGRDRVLWYLLSTHMKKSPDTLYKVLPGIGERWKNPEYFSDIFNELCLAWTGASKWDRMWNLYQVMEQTGPPSSVSQYAVVLASLIRSGTFAVPGKNRDDVVKKLYLKAVSGGKLYYRMIAAAALGKGLELVAPSDDGGRGGNGVPTGRAGNGSRASLTLVEGFFRFGLYAEAYKTAEGASELLTDTELFDIAGKLAAAGRHVEALRLLSRRYLPEDVPFPKEILEALFPRAFAEHIDPLASKEKYLPAFLYGLIKEESYFNPVVVSGAGAVGLSQLLPSTAKDIGGRIGIRNPDLADPGTNLRIGARYLGILLEKYDEPLYALSGYNAGYGRIGSWVEKWGALPFEVFAEKLPYAETRMYIRKVVTATVFYACLYEGSSVEKAVSYFFPGIRLK